MTDDFYSHIKVTCKKYYYRIYYPWIAVVIATIFYPIKAIYASGYIALAVVAESTLLIGMLIVVPLACILFFTMLYPPIRRQYRQRKALRGTHSLHMID